MAALQRSKQQENTRTGQASVAAMFACALILGCAPELRDEEADRFSDTETSSTSTTAAESSSTTGPDDSIWDPANDAYLFATGSDAADAAWLSTGFAIVDQRGVTLYDEYGDSINFYSPGRPVYMGVFDDDRIILGDTAKYTVLGANLEVLSSANLVEPCASGVVFNNRRLACATSRDYGQVFYTYDLDTGEYLSVTEDFHGAARHLRRVPGSNDVIALPGRSTPAQLELFQKTGNTVEMLGESPHLDFFQSAHYAFLGDPATHVVVMGGEILQIHADEGGCPRVHDPTPGVSCLIRDATLGVLPSEVPHYLDLRGMPDGTLLGLYPTEDNHQAVICNDDNPCILQRVDVEARVVLEEKQVTMADLNHYFMYPHPDGRGVAIVGHSENRWSSQTVDLPSGAWHAYFVGI